VPSTINVVNFPSYVIANLTSLLIGTPNYELNFTPSVCSNIKIPFSSILTDQHFDSECLKIVIVFSVFNSS